MNVTQTKFIPLLVALACFTGSVQATSPIPPQGNQNSYKYGMKPYPAARPGQRRLTIHLPQKPNEASLKVELTPGRQMRVDCSVSNYIGQLVKKTAQGWGFTYYEVAGIRGPIQSRRCPSGQITQGFIPVHIASNSVIAYNSKLPIVVYVPNGFDVKYRVLVPQQGGLARPE